MDLLQGEGLILAATRKDLLSNSIVLIGGPASVPVRPTGTAADIDALRALLERADLLAIGNPDTVPVGRYAVRALTTCGLYPVVQSKLALGGSVREVLQYVQNGSAPLGIVFATDVPAAAPGSVRQLFVFPDESVGVPIVYPAAVVSASRSRNKALKMIEFLPGYVGQESVPAGGVHPEMNLLSPILLSLRVAVLATAITLVVGLGLARLFTARAVPLRRIWESLILLPLVFPPTITGYLLLVLFGKRSPLGLLLSQLGLSVVFTWVAAVIASFVVSLPLMFQNCKAALRSVDPQLENAARTLGLVEKRIFLLVTLPLATPAPERDRALLCPRPRGVRRHPDGRRQHPRQDPDDSPGPLCGGGRRAQRGSEHPACRHCRPLLRRGGGGEHPRAPRHDDTGEARG